MIFRSVRARRGENWRRLPGDELVPDALGSLTHAVTIRRPRNEVWPWLVQMGAGRAGWYSYDRVDNGGQPSAERLVPELQTIKEGDILPASPGVTEGFVVLQCEWERYLVLGWLSATGLALMTWAFVLEECKPGWTRLLVRARATKDYRPPFGLPGWTVTTLVPLGHLVMQRKQLLGIAKRAEDRDQLLDGFLPRYDVHEYHQTKVAAPAELTFAIAADGQFRGCHPRSSPLSRILNHGGASAAIGQSCLPAWC